MAAKYVISKTSNSKYHFVLKASNGEVILSSQTYDALDGARKGIDSVKANGPQDAKYQRLTSKKNEPYFTLLSDNGQIVGQSEMYSSERARDGGIASVKANCGAAVEDQSAPKPAA
jgi:hypothetical protein